MSNFSPCTCIGRSEYLCQCCIGRQLCGSRTRHYGAGEPTILGAWEGSCVVHAYAIMGRGSLQYWVRGREVVWFMRTPLWAYDIGCVGGQFCGSRARHYGEPTILVRGREVNCVVHAHAIMGWGSLRYWVRGREVVWFTRTPLWGAWGSLRYWVRGRAVVWFTHTPLWGAWGSLRYWVHGKGVHTPFVLTLPCAWPKSHRGLHI
jgi:3',5'-cyclic AMP phosphodiesterase CpdA